jgi:tetratricopeptide (TPR) repeat protein
VLTVATRAGDVVVEGTVFTVDVARQEIDLRVFRGGVRVERPGRDPRRVRLGQALGLGGDRVTELTEQDQAEARALLKTIDLLVGERAATLEVESIPAGAAVALDDVALGRTPLVADVRAGGRHLSVVLDDRRSVREILQLAAGEETRRVYELTELASDAGPGVRGRGGPAASAGDKATPQDLLETARGFRSAGQFKQAAAAYEELATRFPASAEGRAALVSAGTINLERLGRPSRALLCFDRYLATAKQGTLAQEAALGRALAFKGLGDREREIGALEAFLASFPGAIQASRAKRRLAQLQSVQP